MRRKWRFGMVLAAVVSTAWSVQASLLFLDTFNRDDNPDINVNAAGSQSGSSAPLGYTVLANDTPVDAAISGNRALVSVGGSGHQRIVPDANFALDAVTQAGGLELSYTVRSGIDFPGTVHGQYSTRLYLGSQGIVENINATQANVHFALTVTILGNGQVTIRSQGTILHQATHGWNRQTDNDIRLVVDTESFAAETENPFSFYINDDLVYSGVFEWRHSDDLRFGLEAGSYSAEFDNVAFSIPSQPSPGFGKIRIQMTDAGAVVSWADGNPEYIYALQHRPDLQTGVWSNVAEEIVGKAGNMEVTNSVTGLTGFYRVKAEFVTR